MPTKSSKKEYQRTETNSNPEEEKPSFWERFAFLNLSFEDKALIAEATLEDSEGDGLYWIQLFLSSLIASFGLLQNSVAVIIGAMLIAPLLRPIKGVAFGITTGQNSLIWKSVILLFASIIITISSAFLFALLIPLRIETSEIIARTAPNLLDLFIAIASAIIAILAIYYKRLSESTAGVAMAAAILPPLCVVGIELSLNNFDAAWGSFFLFLTNLFAILSVGVIVFLIYGFYPHHEDTQQRTTKSVLILFILLALISIPLFSSLTEIAEKISLQSKAKGIVQSSLQETIPEAKLDRLELLSFNEDSADFFSVIKIPEHEDFFLETRNTIREQLGNALNREVKLEIEIIPIASIVSLKEIELSQVPSKDRQIKNILSSFFNQPGLKTSVISIDVIPAEQVPEADSAAEEIREDQEKWTIKTIFTLPAGENFEQGSQQTLEEKVQAQFPDDHFTFLWVPLSETATGKSQATETANDRHLKEVTLQWESFFKKTLPPLASAEDITITWTLPPAENPDQTRLFNPEDIQEYTLNFDLEIPTSELKNIDFLRERIRLFSRINYQKPVNINMRIFPFTIQEITAAPNEETSE